VCERNWRRIHDFSADERAVIRERYHGWEKANTATLADIFRTTTNTIRSIVRSVD